MAIKTFHLTNAYHETSGGVRTFYQNLLVAAERRRQFVRLMVPGRRTRVEDVGEFGRIYHVSARPMPLFDSRYRYILPHRFLLSSRAAIWTILRNEQADVIDISDKYSLCYISTLIRGGHVFLDGEGRSRPTMVGSSCERMDDNVAAFIGLGERGRRLSRQYMRRIHGRQFDFFLANSDYTAAEIRDAVAERHQDRVHVLPRGVDTDTFTPARQGLFRRELCERIGASDTAVILLYVGRLSPEKNPAVLPALMRELLRRSSSRYHLVLAGEGPFRPKLESLIGLDLTRQIHFLGHVEDREELARLYASCDIYVHPNPREPFGIAPLEACASGAAIVAPRAGGILTFLNESNAWLTEATPEAFASAILQIESNLDERQRRQQAARDTAMRYRWDHVTDRWLDLYEQLHLERLARHRRAVAASA
jgi:alpha-1,6-mannosyltransferase